MKVPEQDAVVAVYETHTGAEEAVKLLQRAGVDMRTLSIVGMDASTGEHVAGYYNIGDRMKYLGKTGTFWGSFWGLLAGSGFFAVPGIGSVLAAGPVVTWIVGALAGAALVGDVSVVGAALYNIGIPKDSVVEYETALKADKYLLIVHGTPKEVETARGFIEKTRPLNVTLHSRTMSKAAVK